MSVIGSNVLAGASGQAVGEYQIDRSLRFDSSSSSYLNRTPSSAGNRKTWTWSGWIKRSTLTGTQNFFSTNPTSGATDTNSFRLRFTSANTLAILHQTGYSIITSQVFRDPSSWFHVVLALDTTQSTVSDRLKLYINGELVTAYGTDNRSTFITQNSDQGINLNQEHRIGNDQDGTSEPFDGYLADVHFIDGQAPGTATDDADGSVTGTPNAEYLTDFGEFDDNGVWQPKKYTGSYGTNGFRLDFSDNSSNAALGTDSSGNSNTWTVNNLTAEDAKTLDGIVLDGSDDYLSFANDSDFDLGQSSEAFTIEAWVKADNASQTGAIFTRGGGASGWNSTNGHNYLLMTYNGSIYFQWWEGSTDRSINGGTLDQGKWTHVAAAYDGTDVKLYKNGTQIASYSNASFGLVTTRDITSIGRHPDDTGDWDGNISNVRVVKGTAVYTQAFTPSIDLTNVTNTIVLCCKSSSSATASVVTPSTITSNGNVAAGTFHDGTSANDSLIDTPTNYEADSGNNGGNYATFNPLNENTHSGYYTLSNGNLDCAASGGTSKSSGSRGYCASTIGMSSGKFYFELTINSATNIDHGVGIATAAGTGIYQSNNWTYRGDGDKYANGSGSSYGASYSAGDVIGVSFDADTGALVCYKNGSSQGTLDTVTTGKTYFFVWGTDSGSAQTYNVTANFGQRAWAYSAPTNFKPLCTTLLPTPTIADGSDYFDVVTYTGNGDGTNTSDSGPTLTTSFSPDFVWIKSRSLAKSHAIHDTIRGERKRLYSDLTNAEFTYDHDKISFNSNGIQVTTNDEHYNNNNSTYVSWMWDAGDDANPVSNTDGSITSSVRANASAGFSIVSYTGSGSNATVGHGLNAAPEWVLVKNRGATSSWQTFHVGIGNTKSMHLNTADATDTASSYWQDTDPTSSVFSIGTSSSVNQSSTDFIAYCFAPVEGYSAFGSYTGNGSSDGPFVYTGFRLRWLMIKRTDSTQDWFILDTERNPYNDLANVLKANDSASEATASNIGDALSNGFKLKNGTYTGFNASGGTYIYAAFSENAFSLNGGLAR